MACVTASSPTNANPNINTMICSFGANRCQPRPTIIYIFQGEEGGGVIAREGGQRSGGMGASRFPKEGGRRGEGRGGEGKLQGSGKGGDRQARNS